MYYIILNGSKQIIWYAIKIPNWIPLVVTPIRRSTTSLLNWWYDYDTKGSSVTEQHLLDEIKDIKEQLIELKKIIPQSMSSSKGTCTQRNCIVQETTRYITKL